MEVINFPSNLYAVQTFNSLIPFKTSNNINEREVKPDTSLACLATTKSNHPTRLLRLVTVPYSCPLYLLYLLVSSINSVGKGPSPTLVVYAFNIPNTLSTYRGAIPQFSGTEQAFGEDEVTYGYDP